MAECVSVRYSTENEGQFVEDQGSTSPDENDMPEKVPSFGFYHIICLLLSITTFLFDMILDIYLAYSYYLKGQGTYFALTVSFIVLPSLLATAFSLRWYINDGDDPSLPKPPLWKWILRIFLLILQLAPLLRYFDTMSYGIQSLIASKSSSRVRQEKLYTRMLEEDSNASLLRLFHCFLHAAPQGIIQLMILILYAMQDKENSLLDVQSWAITFSVISVAWSLTSYNRSSRSAREDKEELAWQGAVMHFLWHFMSTVSRILALSMLASLFPAWMGTVCICHWAVMSLWLALGYHQGVCSNRCEEILFSAILGVAFIFAFIAPRDGPTRYSYLAYYLVVFMENTGALVVWCVTRSSAVSTVMYYGAVIAQISSFLLAIMLMLLYYRHFHPTGTSANLRATVRITLPDVNKRNQNKNVTRPA